MVLRDRAEALRDRYAERYIDPSVSVTNGHSVKRSLSERSERSVLQSKIHKTMAKIEYAFPVEKVHGKISKKHKIGFAHRTASGVNYSTAYGKRSTKPSTAEIANREKFKAVAQAAQARLINPEFIQRDLYGFSKQTKYTTLWGYVFNEVYQSWEG